ncbi:MAG: hypothetical protein ACM3UW_04685 [Bacillota bacterium]
MRILFVALAVSLLILYSPYLWYILRGTAEEFESRLQQEVTASLEFLQSNPWRVLLPVVVIALLLEASYFVSAWLVFDRVVFRGITMGFVLFEVFHLGRTLWYLPGFISGRVKVDTLISWALERTSAIAFSIHAILGLILIIWP